MTEPRLEDDPKACLERVYADITKALSEFDPGDESQMYHPWHVYPALSLRFDEFKALLAAAKAVVHLPTGDNLKALRDAIDEAE